MHYFQYVYFVYFHSSCRYQNKVQGRVNRLTLAIQEEREERENLMYELKLLRLRAGVNGIGQQIRRNRKISPLLNRGKLGRDPAELQALRERLREEHGSDPAELQALRERLREELGRDPAELQALRERLRGELGRDPAELQVLTELLRGELGRDPAEIQALRERLREELGSDPAELQALRERLRGELGRDPAELQALRERLRGELGSDPAELQDLRERLGGELGRDPAELQALRERLREELGRDPAKLQALREKLRGEHGRDPAELQVLRELLREELQASDLQNGNLEARFPGLLARRPLLAHAIAERQNGIRGSDGQGQEFHRLQDILGQGKLPRRALLRERRRRLRRRYRLAAEADQTNVQDHYESDSSVGDDYPHDATNKGLADAIHGSRNFPPNPKRAGNMERYPNQDRAAAEHPYEEGERMANRTRPLNRQAQRRPLGQNTPNGRIRNSDPHPPARKRDPLPQLHEGGYLSGPSPTEHQGVYDSGDPLRGSKSNRPAPPSYTNAGRGSNHDGSSSRREKPLDPDLLSPLTRARQAKGRVPQPSRIPVKVTP